MGVQLPDSLVDEAVSQSDGAGTVAPVPSPRGQEAEQEGLAHNHGPFGARRVVCVT